MPDRLIFISETIFQKATRNASPIFVIGVADQAQCCTIIPQHTVATSGFNGVCPHLRRKVAPTNGLALKSRPVSSCSDGGCNFVLLRGGSKSHGNDIFRKGSRSR